MPRFDSTPKQKRIEEQRAKRAIINARRKENAALVSCKDCGKQWRKRRDQLKDWKGRCRQCDQLSAERKRSLAKAIPLLRGERASGWKGGLPKCPDCGKQIRYQSTRCSKCFHTSTRGRPLTLEHRKKMSDALKGEKHPCWQGGLTDKKKAIYRSFEYRCWRRAVFERDNFTCQTCGIRSTKGIKIYLQADHIKPVSEYPELMFDVNNGRTLCKPCHKETDTWFWKQAAKVNRARRKT